MPLSNLPLLSTKLPEFDSEIYEVVSLRSYLPNLPPKSRVSYPRGAVEEENAQQVWLKGHTGTYHLHFSSEISPESFVRYWKHHHSLVSACLWPPNSLPGWAVEVDSSYRERFGKNLYCTLMSLRIAYFCVVRRWLTLEIVWSFSPVAFKGNHPSCVPASHRPTGMHSTWRILFCVPR